MPLRGAFFSCFNLRNLAVSAFSVQIARVEAAWKRGFSQDFLNYLQCAGGDLFAGGRFKAADKSVEIGENEICFLLVQLHTRAS